MGNFLPCKPHLAMFIYKLLSKLCGKHCRGVCKWQNKPKTKFGNQIPNTFRICKWICFAISRFAIIKEIASAKGKKRWKICILAILPKVHSDKKCDLFKTTTTNYQRFTLNQNKTYLSAWAHSLAQIWPKIRSTSYDPSSNKLKHCALNCFVLHWVLK